MYYTLPRTVVCFDLRLYVDMYVCTHERIHHVTPDKIGSERMAHEGHKYTVQNMKYLGLRYSQIESMGLDPSTRQVWGGRK